MKRRVLLVDDEPMLLDGLKRQLRNNYDVSTAISGKEALDVLKQEAPFDVIVSDMRMPEMNGVVFLEHAQKAQPDAVRMMLTGNADQMTAIEAVNRGSVFRFLNKPADTERLVDAIEACGRQHDLIVSEKVLLQSTLSGSVRVLMDILAIAHPETFGKSQILKSRAAKVAKALKIGDIWKIELAAMFSRIGTVVLPPNILVKTRAGQDLTQYEAKLVARVPTLGAELISQIPRLDDISKILIETDLPVTGNLQSKGGIVPSGPCMEARILRLLNDLLDLEDKGLSLTRAFFVLRNSTPQYDNEVLETAESVLMMDDRYNEAKAFALSELQIGMRVTQNIVTKDGQILVTTGSVISLALINRLKNVAGVSSVVEPIFAEPLRNYGSG